MTTQIIRRNEGVIATGRFCTFNRSKPSRSFTCDGAADRLQYTILFSKDMTPEQMFINETETQLIINGVINSEEYPYEIVLNYQYVVPEKWDDWINPANVDGVSRFMEIHNYGDETMVVELKIPDSLIGVMKVITPDDNDNLSTVATPNGLKSCILPTPPPQV